MPKIRKAENLCSYSDKQRTLYCRQADALKTFLKKGAITEAQYKKALIAWKRISPGCFSENHYLYRFIIIYDIKARLRTLHPDGLAFLYTS